MVDSNVLLRWILVIFMAFFLAIMLDNPDRNVRLVAALFLIVFAQIREISLVNDAGGPIEKKQKSQTQNPKPVVKKREFKSQDRGLNSSEKNTMRSYVQKWQKSRV